MSTGRETKEPNLVSMPADWALSGDRDEISGSEPIINLTDTARSEVRRLIESEGQPGLRLGIKGGGCSGLTYDLQITDAPGENDKVIMEHGVALAIDKKCYVFLAGTTLDYSGGLNGKGFVFNNPNAKTTCGCGTSFSV